MVCCCRTPQSALQTKKARPKPRPEMVPRPLVLGRLRRCGHDVHAAAVPVEPDFAVRQREQGPIAARADILARDELRAALPNDDAASGDGLAAKRFYAEPFTDAVASVPDAALTFFMCHTSG